MGSVLKGPKKPRVGEREKLKTLYASLLILILVLSPFTSYGRSFALLTPVADLTGQWSGFGTFDEVFGCRQTVKLNADIKQDGNNIKGTYSFVSTGSKAIKEDVDCSKPWDPTQGTFEGTLDGSRISVTLSDDGLTYTGTYATSGIKLSVNSDWLTGTIQLSPTNFTPPPFEQKTQPAAEPKQEPAPVPQPQEEKKQVPPPSEEEPVQNQPADDSAEMDKAIGDFEKEQTVPGDWAEGAPEEPQTSDGGGPIVQDHKIGELKIDKGSAAITDSDGNQVTTGEIKLGTTIQTGTNADTNVKISLDDGSTVNLKENTQLGTVGIGGADDDLSFLFDDVKKLQNEADSGVDQDLSFLFDDAEKLKNKPGGVDEDLSFLFDDIEKLKSEPNSGVDQDLSFLFEDAKKAESKTIANKVNDQIGSFMEKNGFDPEKTYLVGTAFNTGLMLGAIPFVGPGAALVATGYVLISGSIYFELFGANSQTVQTPATEKNQKVIFTPNAILVPHGTEFAVTVENGKTKLDVIGGEVSVIPLDTTKQIATAKAGDSFTISDTSIEKAILNNGSKDKWQDNTLQTQQVQQPTPQPTSEPSKGGCLVATAAFGSELSPQIQMLREIRDNTLFGTNSGTTFMLAFNSFYYSFSPTVSDWERQNPVFKEMVKVTITPMLSTLSILNYVDVSSEQNVLVYGIAIILLNIGMYFVAPALVVTKLVLRKK